MDLSTIDPIVWIAIGVAIVALIVFFVARARRKKQTDELRERFGPEYDRTVAREGSRSKAEAELRERQVRYEKLQLREIDGEERRLLLVRWDELQGSFIDGPESAVRGAEVVLDDTARARGYPDADPEQRMRDLAVDHSDQVDAYRRTRTPTDRKGNAEKHDVDSLRKRLLAARELFEALLGPEPEGDEVAAPAAPFDRDATDLDATHRTASDRPTADRDAELVDRDQQERVDHDRADHDHDRAERDHTRSAGEADRAPADAGRISGDDVPEPGDHDRHAATGGVVPPTGRDADVPDAPFERVLGDEPPPPPAVDPGPPPVETDPPPDAPVR